MQKPSEPASPARPWWRDPMHRAVHAVGITQITAWGTAFYCLGVLAAPIGQELGFTRSFVFLGFTVAILTQGLVSAPIGRLIDRWGGRNVLSLGVVLIAIGLAMLAHVTDWITYLAVWVFLGVAMRMSLYDASFAAIVQVAPSRGRTAISYLTLYGAFASTVFWVVGHQLDEAVGWRNTLLIFAALNLVICLPLNWWGLAKREERPKDAPAANMAARPVDGTPLEGRARTIGMVLFALIMSLNGFVFGVVSVQLVPLFETAGMATATAVWIASLKGVAQFCGRVIEIVFGRNLHAFTVARFAIGALPFSLLLLLFSNGAFAPILAFTLLMGASQGVITIVRGAVPLALFGTEGYGRILGLIATPILVVSALAPTVYALILDTWGSTVGVTILFVSALLAMLAIELMGRWYRRNQAGL
jgi:predicted MFS family arabinose efflux permease